MKHTIKKTENINYYYEGILAGNRIVLGQAITLVESTLASHQLLASALIDKVIHKTGKSLRIGITGVPGVGKSTFIEAFGKAFIDSGSRLAVLTIDPSSQLTKGSILGDKTRMDELSKNMKAFIRPSAAGNALGGVAHKTREAMLLCEAAGYDVIFIETVGVGQSEISVKNMVDFFLLLMLAGAGDELQGIKKGIMEIADAIVITKADGENLKKATEAQAEYQHALHLFSANDSGWKPQVLTSSALEGRGIIEIVEVVKKYHQQVLSTGFFDQQRKKQNVSWLREFFNHLLQTDVEQREVLREEIKTLEAKVADQLASPYSSAERLLNIYHESIRNHK